MKTPLRIVKEENSSSHDKKRCTTCLQELPITEFYSKGKRRDSVCKECKKQKSKNTYVSRKKTTPLKVLNRFIDLMTEIELELVRDLQNEITQVIEGKNNGSIERRKPKKSA